MILRFHSPLPPERTGVADYSAALLPELERVAQVIVNPTGPTPGPHSRGSMTAAQIAARRSR